MGMSSCKSDENRSILLKEPTIINVHNGQLTTQSIVIENGFIREIGDFDMLVKKNLATIIDCEGKYIIPGMFDMHMHIAEEENMILELDRLVQHGITGIRDMGGIADSIAHAKHLIQNGNLQGPDIYFAGFTLDGPQTNDPFHFKVYDTTNIKALVADLEKTGVDFLKVHNYFPNHKLVELKQAGNELGLKITGHIPVGVGLTELDSVGIKCVEHINSLISSIVLKESNGVNNLEDAFTALDSTYISNLSTYFKKNDIAITPTLYAMDDMYSNLENESSKAMGLRLMALFHEILRWMSQNDVMILAGTDRGPITEANIDELQDELAILVTSGMSPLEALQCATINPAKFLEIETAYGTVEVNKKANLVVLNSNPLKDISNTKDIHFVLKNGELFKES
ncbi:MAG: amidohydrolase family protein [Aureisphaera sp.]